MDFPTLRTDINKYKRKIKSKKNICLVDSVLTMFLGNKSDIVGKPVYSPFKWCRTSKEHALLE